MPDRDIVAEIAQLVDTQLANYGNRSGYDFNVNQDRCRHCHGEWHGLKITQRMRDMRRRGVYDEEYRYADDDSTVLCPGSAYEGEFERPASPVQLAALAGIPSQAWHSGGRISSSRGGGGPAPSPIVDMETVDRLRNMRLTATVARELVGRPAVESELFHRFEHAASQHFPGVRIHHTDLMLDQQPDSPTYMMLVDVMWRPRSNEVEFLGGPRHGETQTGVDVERCREMHAFAPVTVTRYRDFDPAAPIQDNIVRYRRFGWNTATRRWVYSTDSNWRPECRYCRYERVHDLSDKYCQGCMRDLIIADDQRDGEHYARTHGIRRPIVATDDSYLRGMDLEMFRVHVVNWPRDATQLLLRQMAERAGRPLESFYANMEQAA
ncbi:hypothetical protein [Nocardia sp. NPDC057455]|uniref:hypothetical protein n=1 Tax=Nocardia sp. NPDC057455 TaxID=3346138 RepID=UPI00366E9098